MITDRTSQCRILHGNSTPRCTARVDKHFTGYFSLQFMDAGEVELFYNSRHHVLEQPAFWFCRPGPRIRFHPGKRGWWSHHYFAFNGVLPQQWLRQGLMPEEPVLCSPAKVSVAIRLMEEIERLVAEMDALAAWQAVNALESLLLEIRRFRIGRKRTFWTDYVAGSWRGSMAEPPDYAALARQQGIALSTFRRLFREEAGTSVHQFVQNLRIEEARLRLENGQETQKEIAAALGYTDVYHFSRDFRRRAGLPPAHYQSSLLGGRRQMREGNAAGRA